MRPYTKENLNTPLAHPASPAPLSPFPGAAYDALKSPLMPLLAVGLKRPSSSQPSPLAARPLRRPRLDLSDATNNCSPLQRSVSTPTRLAPLPRILLASPSVPRLAYGASVPRSAVVPPAAATAAIGPCRYRSRRSRVGAREELRSSSPSRMRSLSMKPEKMTDPALPIVPGSLAEMYLEPVWPDTFDEIEYAPVAGRKSQLSLDDNADELGDEDAFFTKYLPSLTPKDGISEVRSSSKLVASDSEDDSNCANHLLDTPTFLEGLTDGENDDDAINTPEESHNRLTHFYDDVGLLRFYDCGDTDDTFVWFQD